MTKKVGRNDPCPCGSGKKYKQCCEHRLGAARKFTASVISSGPAEGIKVQAPKISTNFFSKYHPTHQEPPRVPEEGEPKHPPEADRPM